MLPSLQVFWCHWHPLLVTLQYILECIINQIKIRVFSKAFNLISIFISVPPLCVSSRSWNMQISWKWLPSDFYLYIAWWIQTSSWNKLLYYVWLFSVHLCFSELKDESFCQNISYLHKIQEFEFKIRCMA